MSVQKNEFFDYEQDKIMEIHSKYSAKDESGRVHCDVCPYSLYNGYRCECLFVKQVERVQRENEVLK